MRQEIRNVVSILCCLNMFVAKQNILIDVGLSFRSVNYFRRGLLENVMETQKVECQNADNCTRRTYA